jgi:hypothetical protein
MRHSWQSPLEPTYCGTIRAVYEDVQYGGAPAAIVITVMMINRYLIKLFQKFTCEKNLSLKELVVLVIQQPYVLRV